MIETTDRAFRAQRIGMALLFYPRGGSAQVAGYLGRALNARGREVTLASGSLGALAARNHAQTFFDGLHVAPFSFDDAIAAYEQGQDPMDAPRPLHPSFEDRDGVPDRVFTAVSPAQIEHAIDSWAEHFLKSGFPECDVLHIHHASFLQLAARKAAPDVPIVTHLHGTDLKLVDAIERGVKGVADRPYAGSVIAMLREASALSAATICISPHDRDEAIRLLGLSEDSIHILPNGVDIERFSPQTELAASSRLERWKRWLVDDPQGWDSATQQPGSIRYSKEALDVFEGDSPQELSPVLLFVGRFLGFKRVPLLVRAYARAQNDFLTRAPLVIWGGAPGEWEGEHPHDVAKELGVKDIYFAGWLGHDQLPDGLASSAALVAPSVNEPFGQVYLEAMACGIPVIGTTTGGPPSFVNVDPDRLDGWLVAPDDEHALAQAMVELVNNPDERKARGQNALTHVREGYAWSALAERFITVYESVLR